MNKLLYSFLPVVSFCILQACSPCIEPEGETETREIMLEKFESIDLRGGASVRLFQGPDQKVEITAPANVMEHLNQNVEDGTWNIFFEPCVDDADIVFSITMPDFKEATVSGSGTITGNGYFNTGEARISVNGSGDIALTVNAAVVTTTVSGSGEVQLAGSANEHRIDISGSGEVDSRDFDTRNTTITVSGSGGASVTVKDALNARVMGNGNIYYYGSPADVKTDIQGSGEIIKK